MTNRILFTDVSNGRLDPAEAQVDVTLHLERLTSDTQARGRLVGPRCAYATTVEVAYPLREQSREYKTTGRPSLDRDEMPDLDELPSLHLRAIIPEPSLWDPESPFLYQGVLGLWQGGQLCHQVRFIHGLRTLSLSPRGLRCNGRPLSLRGVAVGGCSEAKIRSLHQAGYNTLLVPADVDTAVWDLADRFGLLVLVRITDRSGLQAELKCPEPFSMHPCCLGYVVTPEAVEDDLARFLAPTFSASDRGCFLGIELKQPPARPLPDRVSFVAAEETILARLADMDLRVAAQLVIGREEETILPRLAGMDLPKIVLRPKDAASGKGSDGPETSPGILGWIDCP